MSQDYIDDPVAWVERIFREENLSYSLDERGGVHYLIDEEFHSSLQSSIAGLSAADFVAAREALERVQPALDVDNTRDAIRAVYDAAENVFKVKFGASRLGASEIGKDIRKYLENTQIGASLDAGKLMLKSFSEWTNAAHQYRHIEGTPDAPPPPLDLAILMISQGFSWVRWLVRMDTSAM